MSGSNKKQNNKKQKMFHETVSATKSHKWSTGYKCRLKYRTLFDFVIKKV